MAPTYEILFHENNTTRDERSIAHMDADTVPASLAVGNVLRLCTQDKPISFTIESVCHEAAITNTNELTRHRVLVQLSRHEE